MDSLPGEHEGPMNKTLIERSTNREQETELVYQALSQE